MAELAVLEPEQVEALKRWRSIHSLHYAIRRQESQRELEVAEFIDGQHHAHLTEDGQLIERPILWMARQLGLTEGRVYQLADHGRKVPALKAAGWSGVGERKGRLLRRVKDPQDIIRVKAIADELAKKQGYGPTARQIKQAMDEIIPPGITEGWEPHDKAPTKDTSAPRDILPLMWARDGLWEVIQKLNQAARRESDCLWSDHYRNMATQLEPFLYKITEWAAR